MPGSKVRRCLVRARANRASLAFPFATATLLFSALAVAGPQSQLGPQVGGGGTGTSTGDRPIPPEVTIAYRAPGECPQAPEFLRDAQGRTPQVVFTESSKDPAFLAEILGTEEGFEGTLAGSREWAHGARRVKGDRCADVSAALSLMIALAVDPSSRLEVGDAGPPLIVTLQVSASARSPSEPSPAAPLLSTNASVFDNFRSASAQASKIRWGLGIGATATTGIGPGVAPGGTIFGEFADVDDRARLRLGLSYARSGDAKLVGTGDPLDGSSVWFSLVSAIIQPCLSPWSGQHQRRDGASHDPRGSLQSSSSLWGLALCARWEIGSWGGHPELTQGQAIHARPGQALWSSVGALTSVSFHLDDTSELRLDAGLGIPIMSTRFVVPGSSGGASGGGDILVQQTPTFQGIFALSYLYRAPRRIP